MALIGSINIAMTASTTALAKGLAQSRAMVKTFGTSAAADLKAGSQLISSGLGKSADGFRNLGFLARQLGGKMAGGLKEVGGLAGDVGKLVAHELGYPLKITGQVYAGFGQLVGRKILAGTAPIRSAFVAVGDSIKTVFGPVVGKVGAGLAAAFGKIPIGAIAAHSLDVASGFAKASVGVARFSLGLGKLAIAGTIKGVAGLTRTVAGLAGGLLRAAGQLAVFGGAATLVAGVAFGKMVGASSNLNENMNKVQAVFGAGAKTVVDESNRMADAFGVSKNQFLDASGRMGGLFKGAGFGATETADLSNQFVKLAADAASFFNTDFETAFQKLRSGLSGEAEPLRDFGVFLTEDKVKAQAYAMGLAKVGGELTDQAKVSARAAIIMSSMADAQGDLARTSDGLANSTREVWGRVENLAASFGETLAPIAGAALQGLNTAVVALQTAWERNKEAVIQWGTSALTSLGLTAGGTGIVQKSIGFIGDAWDTVGLAFKYVQSYMSERLAKLADDLAFIAKAFDALKEKITGTGTGYGAMLDAMAKDLHKLSAEQYKEFQDHLVKPWPSESVDKYFADAGAKVKALRDEMAAVPKALGGPTVAGGTAGKGKKEQARDQFAAAMLAGSSEAAGTVLRSRYGSGKDPIAVKTADNTAKTVDRLDQLVSIQRQMWDATKGAAGPSLLTLDDMV